MKEQGAFREETASLEEVAGYQWEEEGMEVSAAKDRHSISFQSNRAMKLLSKKTAHLPAKSLGPNHTSLSGWSDKA